MRRSSRVAGTVMTMLVASCSRTTTTPHNETTPSPPASASTAAPTARLPDTPKEPLRMSDDVMRFTATGWTPREMVEPDGHRSITFTGPDAGTAVLDVWPGLPPTPGGAMAVASKRNVVVDGVTLALVRTRVFAGQAEAVDVLFANDGHAYARLVFRNCSPESLTTALASVRLSAATKNKKP